MDGLSRGEEPRSRSRYCACVSFRESVDAGGFVCVRILLHFEIEHSLGEFMVVIILICRSIMGSWRVEVNFPKL